MKELFRIWEKDILKEKFTFGEFVAFGIAMPIGGAFGVWLAMSLAQRLLQWAGWL